MRQHADRLARPPSAPRHVAFIMDGNGRWAVERGLPRSAGHKAGYERIRLVLETCEALGVEIVSCYAWSTENWERPQAEVDYIVRSVERELPGFADELRKRGVRFVHSGAQDGLPAGTRRALESAVEATRGCGPRAFNLVFNYGGRAEIAHVARCLLQRGLRPEQVSERDVEASLWTRGLPDVDLVVRTGGEARLSNFLLWQTARALFHVLDTYWPAITPEEIETAVAAYSRQGGIAPAREACADIATTRSGGRGSQ